MIPRNDNERMSAWLERAWLQNYLERGLDDEESAWFEAYVLDKPELLQVIETDTDLRDGLAVAAAEQSSFATAGVDSRPRSSSMPRWLALAAMLVVGIGTGLITSRLVAPAGEPGVIASPARIVYDTMRGATLDPQFDRRSLASQQWLIEVALPGSAGEIELLVGDAPPRALSLESDAFVSFVISRAEAIERREARIRYTVDGVVRESTVAFPME